MKMKQSKPDDLDQGQTEINPSAVSSQDKLLKTIEALTERVKTLEGCIEIPKKPRPADIAITVANATEAISKTGLSPENQKKLIEKVTT